MKKLVVFLFGSVFHEYGSVPVNSFAAHTSKSKLNSTAHLSSPQLLCSQVLKKYV